MAIGTGLAILGGSLIGAAATSKSASKAAGAQQAATDAAIGEQQRQYDLTRQDFAPYREAGANALQQLQGEVGRMPTAQEVMAQPGYQFGIDQGMQAMQRRSAAMGGRVSGAALKAASRFGTDYATSGYNAEYQRRQDRLNRLAALAGLGQTSTGASAQSGMNYANQAGNMLSSMGDARAAASMAQGNAWGNAGNQLAAMYIRQQQGQTPGYGGASFGGPLDGFFGGTGGSGD